MRNRNSVIRMIALMGVLFLSASSVYAETTEEYFNSGKAHSKEGN